jgi:hypothetical protein
MLHSVTAPYDLRFKKKKKEREKKGQKKCAGTFLDKSMFPSFFVNIS